MEQIFEFEVRVVIEMAVHRGMVLYLTQIIIEKDLGQYCSVPHIATQLSASSTSHRPQGGDDYF